MDGNGCRTRAAATAVRCTVLYLLTYVGFGVSERACSTLPLYFRTRQVLLLDHAPKQEIGSHAKLTSCGHKTSEIAFQMHPIDCARGRLVT